MKRIALKLLLLLIVGIFLVGCAARGYRTEGDDFVPHRFDTGQYHKKVDNFLVILDASSSMMETYQNLSKFYLAKNTVYKMNLTVPELGYTAGLRSFGRILIYGRPPTQRVYGMTGYTTEGFTGGIEAVKWAGGSTPMSLAIDGADADLKSLPGNTAVIIVGDGLETEGQALPAVKALKEKYLNRLCIYTIHVGDNPSGKSMMEKIADIGGCGFSVNADDLASSNGMADFVEKVFLAKAEKAAPAIPAPKPAPKDSDGDGVYDDQDKCPGTPAGVSVDSDGCPLDTDLDGVYDYLDKCPGTPGGVKVDKVGCPLDTDGDGVYDYLDKCPGTPNGAKVDGRGCWTLGNVLFDFDKWNVKQKFAYLLDHVVKVMKKNPYLKLKLEGYTCDIGTEEYNQGLSDKRASSVRTYLEGQGINATRLDSAGHGESSPAYPNDSRANRAKNRRVELTPRD